MKRAGLMIIILMAMASCQIDEPDMYTQDSFTKVYGLDGLSVPGDAIEMPNGDFIIVGNFHKASNSEEISGPFILRTDANGNQIQFRNFYIARGKAQGLSDYIAQSLGITSLDDTWNAILDFDYWTPYFASVTALNNGNFFLLGQFIGESEEVYESVIFSLIVDDTLKPIQINFLNNTQIELADGIERTISYRDPKPILMDNGDVIALLGRPWLNYWQWYPGYGINRFNELGEVIQVHNIPTIDEVHLSPDSWILKDQDHVVICGTYLDPGPWEVGVALERDNDIYIHNINLGTGEIEKETLIGIGNCNWTYRGGIQATDNGFVLGDYHMDTVGQNFDYNNDGYRNVYGGLWFVDENLDSLGKAHTTDLEVEIQIGRIVQTTDGGFAAAYSRQYLEGSDVLIVKTDPQGKVLWRRELNLGVGDDLVWIEKIIATRDGGIAILAEIDFNSMGSRVNLIKLSSDGSF